MYPCRASICHFHLCRSTLLLCCPHRAVCSGLSLLSFDSRSQSSTAAMTTTPTGAFLPPLSNRSSPLSSRRNSADDKQRKPNSRSGSSENPALSARRTHIVTAGEQLLAKRAEEERKERERHTAAHSTHFPSPPISKLTTDNAATSRIAVSLPRDLLPSKRLSQSRRPPPHAAASANNDGGGSTATFDLEATWGQRDEQNSAASLMDGAMARATFQTLLRDTEADGRRRQQEEEKLQTSSQPPQRSHNTYAPPAAKSTFLPFATASQPSPASSTTSDSGLISALTQRVHTLEALTQQQTRQMAVKQQEVLQLQVERDVLVAASNSSKTATPAPIAVAESQQLRGEYERLVQQVSEMEQFLSDYGLQWIGDSSTATAGNSDTRMTASTSVFQTSSSMSSPSTLPFHLPTLLQRVDQLNGSLPPTSLLISQQSSVTRFQPPPYLLLTLYRDGLTLTQSNHREQPLRAYESSQAAALLGDILDGFFPSEWRSTWPDGVRIVVADSSGEKREEVARRRRRERQRSWHAFEGAGRRVRETPQWRAQVSADEEAEREKQVEQTERRQKAKEAFLSRLPATTVTAAGRLVEVKAIVQRMVDGDSRDGPTSVWQRGVEVRDSDTLALLHSSGRPVQPPFDPSLAICTLHVHVQHTSSSDGVRLADSSFLVLLQGAHTMAAVLALLQRHVLSSSTELRPRQWRLHWASLHPRVVVEIEEVAGGAASNQIDYGRVDEKCTVEAAGWRHNCSVFVHVRSL